MFALCRLTSAPAARCADFCVHIDYFDSTRRIPQNPCTQCHTAAARLYSVHSLVQVTMDSSRSSYVFAAEYLALLPVAPLVEIWAFQNDVSWQRLALLSVHVVACSMFWMSVGWPEARATYIFPISSALLVYIWFVNAVRAPAVVAKIPNYKIALQLFSAVNGLTGLPLAGKPGRWFVVALSGTALLGLAMVAAVAPEYYRAWGCYPALNYKTTFAAQRNGVCFDPRSDDASKSAACYKYQGATVVCPQYTGEELRAFRGVFVWLGHQLAIGVALYTALIFRAEQKGLIVRLRNKLQSFKSKKHGYAARDDS